jgi:hypothetical protein
METAQSEVKLERLALELKKLQIEVACAARAERWDLAIKLLPALTVLVTVLGFLFSISQFRSEQREKRAAFDTQSTKERIERDDRNRVQIDAAQREFMKPLIEKQQTLYFEAASSAAAIASSSDARERSKAVDNFWRLYFGPLVMVESKTVSGAMSDFGNCLSKIEPCNSENMKNRSLALASALEESLLKTWNARPEEFSNNQFKYR